MAMILRHCSTVALALNLLSPACRAIYAQGVQREQPAPAPIRPNSRFTLTPTQNIWTSLLLDTSTGRIWQVVFAVSDSVFAGRLALNEEAFAPPTTARVGRFTLHETQNIFTFLLLDQDDGRVWQVQWSTDAEKRGVMRQLSAPIR